MLESPLLRGGSLHRQAELHAVVLVVVLQLFDRVLWFRVFLGLLEHLFQPPPTPVAVVVVHALVLQRCHGREVRRRPAAPGHVAAAPTGLRAVVPVVLPSRDVAVYRSVSSSSATSS